MKIKNNKAGFTLLELVVVVIIVAVMASLALPRLISQVEQSRAAEAYRFLGVIRDAMEQHKFRNGNYTTADLVPTLLGYDPGAEPNAHFNYTIPASLGNTYTIRATRTTRAGGTAGDYIQITFDGTNIVRSGTGAFASES